MSNFFEIAIWKLLTLKNIISSPTALLDIYLFICLNFFLTTELENCRNVEICEELEQEFHRRAPRRNLALILIYSCRIIQYPIHRLLSYKM